MGARITNLKISGIKSIEIEIELSFNDNNIKDSLLTERSNVKGFYVENGTGKSAIVHALDIL